MSSVKESNTSKTAHVMNLLSRSRTASPVPQPDGAADPASPGKAPVVQTPPIIASMQNDIAVAAKIKDALELNLAAELDPDGSLTPDPVESSAPPTTAEVADTQTTEPSITPAEAPQIADPDVVLAAAEPPVTADTELTPAQLPVEGSVSPSSIGAPVQDTPPQPEAIADLQEGQQLDNPPPAGDSDPAAAPASPVARKAGLTNIMALLVEEKVEKYIGLFGLCPCDRCRDDVTALALNSLPPKYVVMPHDNVAPRLAVYDGRFSAAVTAQILRACKEVLENPRHDLT